MRKCLTVLVSICIAMLMFCETTAHAVEARYAYFTYITSTLTISSNTAYCKSSAAANSTVTKIEGTQYLEKKSGDNWVTVKDCKWSDSEDMNYLTLSNSKSNLGSGTYRVRAVFTAYSENGSEEEEKISKEVTI